MSAGKEEIVHNEQFLLFPVFFTFWRIVIKFQIVVCKLFQFRPVWNIVIWERVNLTHSNTMTPFDTPGKQAFWKQWEKEKLLVTSNFSFSHSVFYLFG